MGKIILETKKLTKSYSNGNNKLDVIYRYNDDEVRTLINMVEIPNFFLDIKSSCFFI